MKALAFKHIGEIAAKTLCSLCEAAHTLILLHNVSFSHLGGYIYSGRRKESHLFKIITFCGFAAKNED